MGDEDPVPTGPDAAGDGGEAKKAKPKKKKAGLFSCFAKRPKEPEDDLTGDTPKKTPKKSGKETPKKTPSTKKMSKSNPNFQTPLVHIASKVAGDSHDLAIMSASAYLMSDDPEISQDAYRT